MTRENIKRPLVHFSPKKGWMNDPNGPVFYKGEYHLFFQHNPDNVYWDNMHWGHAKSKDLIHWEELPIALFPDEQGMIFSGSAFVDKRNDSGLGKEDSPALLLFYTSHDHKTMREMQCMAYTTDGKEFIKYDKNPLIGGKEHTPARDPHVFENKIIGGYSMCFTIENAIVFYHSTNLLSWEKTGEFKLPEYALQGMIECPCMLEFEKYVLMMSMDAPESEYNKFPKNAEPHSRTMQYFYGDFNGYTFVPDKEQNEVLLVDYGKDFYAGTVFSNIKEKILIAWMGDFSKEAKKVKTEEEGFKGTLSYPRKIELRKTSKGYRLHHEFCPCPEGVEGIFYEKSEEEERLNDRIISESIKENGFIPSTNYMVK